MKHNVEQLNKQQHSNEKNEINTNITKYFSS